MATSFQLPDGTGTTEGGSGAAAMSGLLDEISRALGLPPATASADDDRLFRLRVGVVLEVLADLDTSDVPGIGDACIRLRDMISRVGMPGGNGHVLPAGPPLTMEAMRADHWQAVAQVAGTGRDLPVAARSQLHDTRTGAVWRFERVTQAPAPGFAGRVLASRPDKTSAELPPGRLGLRLVPKS